MKRSSKQIVDFGGELSQNQSTKDSVHCVVESVCSGWLGHGVLLKSGLPAVPGVYSSH